MSALVWRASSCHEDCTSLLMDGEHVARVGTFRSGKLVQWFGPKKKGGLEESLVAAQDMAMRECGFLADTSAVELARKEGTR